MYRMYVKISRRTLIINGLFAVSGQPFSPGKRLITRKPTADTIHMVTLTRQVRVGIICYIMYTSVKIASRELHLHGNRSLKSPKFFLFLKNR